MSQSNIIRLETIHFPLSYKTHPTTHHLWLISHTLTPSKQTLKSLSLWSSFPNRVSGPESLLALRRFKTTEQNKRMIYNIDTNAYITTHEQLPAPPPFGGTVYQKPSSIRKKEHSNRFQLIRPCFRLEHRSITQYRTRCWPVKHSV